MKRLLFPLLLVWASGPLLGQTPTPAQGRDYLNLVYRVVSVDSQGRIIISPTGIVAPCPGTVAIPCIVAGPDAPGAAPTQSPVLQGGQDGAPGVVRVIKTDALGQLIPANASSADADGVSNTEATPTGAAGGILYPRVFARVFNGATWDRLAGNTSGLAIANASSALADGLSNTELSQTAVAGGVIYPRTFCHYFNGATWDRCRGNATGSSPSSVSAANADALSNTEQTPTDAAGNVLFYRTQPAGFNGATYDRRRTASLANDTPATTLTARNSVGAGLMEFGSRWIVNSSPATSSQASASIAAEASVRHVADQVCFSAQSTGSGAITATAITVQIRDGASGAGTVIRSFQVAFPVAAGIGQQEVAPFCTPTGMGLVGTTNTAMTAEFSAGVTNANQTISISGYNVN